MTHLTCPHCGQRFTFEGEVERVDINGEPAYFLPTPPGVERHIDQRVACPTCWERADNRRRDEKGEKQGPHPYGSRYHSEVRLANAVHTK